MKKLITNKVMTIFFAFGMINLLSGCAKTITEPVYLTLEEETLLWAMSEYKHQTKDSQSRSRNRLSIGSFPAGMKVRVVEWYRGWNAEGTDKELIQTICKEDLTKCGRRSIPDDDLSDEFTDVFGDKHDLEIRRIFNVKTNQSWYVVHNLGAQTLKEGEVFQLRSSFPWTGYDEKFICIHVPKHRRTPYLKDRGGKICDGYIATGELWNHQVSWTEDAIPSSKNKYIDVKTPTKLYMKGEVVATALSGDTLKVIGSKACRSVKGTCWKVKNQRDSTKGIVRASKMKLVNRVYEVEKQ